MSWARRLKRVFGIEIERCVHCGGTLEIIAKILSHLQRTAPQPHQPALPLGARAPPVPSSLI